MLGIKKTFYNSREFWDYANVGDDLAPGVIKKAPILFPKVK